MFKEKIQPTMVLVLVCIITCTLLAWAYQATYKDTTGMITDEMKNGLTEIYGFSDGFEIMKNKDGTVWTVDGVNAILFEKNNGYLAYEIFSDGYNSNGLHVIVGLEHDYDYYVKKVAILGISETPGLGTKIEDDKFLAQFEGLTYEMLGIKEDDEVTAKPAKSKAVWGTNEDITALKADLSANAVDTGFKLDAVTGATRSSNGMYNAVKLALTVTYDNSRTVKTEPAYDENGGDLNG